MNCKPGDLAFVIRSAHPGNLMKIVEVIKPYEPSECGIVIVSKSRQLWLCEAQGSDLVWSDLVNQPMTRAARGPIPDECLFPIKPEKEGEQNSEPERCTPPTACTVLEH
jgi:hypothetical protein